MDPAQMQAFVDAIIAAATAAINAANRAAVQVAPPAPTTSLLPGSANLNPLDWTKAESMMLFNKAESSIENKFSLSEDTLHTFI
jgi:hypothetical protein